MRTLLHRLAKHDPTTFMGTFAGWSICVGGALLFAPDAFVPSAIWDIHHRINANSNLWGGMYVIDGVLLLAALRLKTVPQRAAITLFSAVLWALTGVAMVYSGYMAGITSIAGPFSILCSIQAGVAVERWIETPMRDRPGHGNQ